MTRKTKNNGNLTLEEKLEQALVPNWDEPYKLPDNWCWVALSALANVISKGTTPTGGKHAYLDNGIPFLRVENINDDGTISHESIVYVSKDMHLNFLRRSILEPDDILVSIAGTLGKTGIVREIDIPLNTNQAIAFVRLNREYIYPKYIKYCIDNPVAQKFLLSQAKVTAIPNLTLEIVSHCPIPLAPLVEQKRIVERIESLFAKLDEAKEKTQAVVDGFEDRKAAILHKAFTGELTEKWRIENGVDNIEYEKKRFDEVAVIKYNLVNPADYQDYPHIAPDNIEKKTGVLLEYRTIAEDNVKSGKHHFYPGQILYSKIRPNLSKVVMVDFEGLCSADMYPIEARGITRCLWYFMLSEYFVEQASSAGSRSVLPKINQKELSALTVTIPNSVEEQKEIVRVVDSLFAKTYQAKETAKQVIDQIDKIKKSILARAFHSELGTNDPNDENAVELLKRILEESDDKPKEKKSASRLIIPKNISEQLSSELEKKIIKSILKNDGKADINAVMSVSSKKFDVMDAIKKLEDKNLIIHDESGEYILKG